MNRRYHPLVPKAICAIFCLLVNLQVSRGQTLVTAPMTSTPAAGSYYSYTDISLQPGFSFAASSTSSLKLYIQSVDCQPFANNLSSSQNYVNTITPRIAGYNPAGSGYGTCDLMQTVQYFDGLGRPLQTVQVKASPAGYDVVQPVAYDAYGREVTKYQPYAATTNDGSYKPASLTEQTSFYNPTGSGTSGMQQSNGVVVNPSPYAQTVFEPSPLNRTTEQGAPGDPWQPGTGSDHTVKISYLTNDATIPTASALNSYGVRLYTVTLSGNSRSLVNSGLYTAGQLYVTITADENWTSGKMNTTEEYKDKDGHVVLKRTFNHNTATNQDEVLSTYYVYDDLENLAFVLPPMAGADAGISSANSQTVLDNLCYQYNYDERNRLIQKKIPGKGWEYIVYNSLDQAVLVQDANQRASNQWTVTKYDAQGRVIVTGLWNAGSAIAQSTLQSSIYAAAQWDSRDESNNTGTNPSGYVISSYPTPTTFLTINYYDDYTAPGLPSYAAPATAVTSVTNLPTAGKTAVLNNPSDMLWTVNYYDGLGRNIQSYKQHYLGGVVSANNYDAISTTYDFTNAPTTVTRKHYNATSGTTPALTVFNRYIYDHMGRKQKTWEQLNGGTTILLQQTDYNPLGQAWIKHLHGTGSDSTAFLQNTTYAYNERGWLQSSSAPLFSLQLAYNGGSNPQYNGNIQSQNWTSAASSGSFVYTYDPLNRLLSGATPGGQYIERSISYDLEGNIKTLSRVYGGTLIDSLSYNYQDAAANTTMQLQSVTDQSSNTGPLGYTTGTSGYQYDNNGNMVADNSKGISGTSGIVYNLLNLPQSISAKGTVYTYSADGEKLRRAVTLNGVTTYTDYIDGIEYDGTSNSNEAITFVQTEEGRSLPNGSTWNYEYNLADHLGDTRLSFDSGTGAARTEQQDNYLPFGMDISVGTINSPQNYYLYNKKESQPSWNVYDYGARFYDPVIGRWTSVDPLAEKDRRWSPYGYGHDNPIRFIDVDGMFVKPGDLFTTIDAAAVDFGKFYNAQSIREGREYASAIYTVQKDGKTYYTYTDAYAGTKASSTAPMVDNTVADAHTHGDYTGNAPNPDDRYDDDHFSPKDIQNYKDDKQPGYVGTPNGEMQKYDQTTNKTTVISKDLPSDPDDPGRKNDISPITGNTAAQDKANSMKPEVAKQDAIPVVQPPPPPPPPIKI